MLREATIDWCNLNLSKEELMSLFKEMMRKAKVLFPGDNLEVMYFSKDFTDWCMNSE